MGAGVFKGPLQGILRCRDLVTLYYGVPMVVTVIESEPNYEANTDFVLLTNNPARIRYELIFVNYDTSADALFITRQPSTSNTPAQEYLVPPGGTLIIDRNFLTDLDAVTWGLTANYSSTNTGVSVRETVLQAPPMDELPQP